MVVERQLSAEGIQRHELGRDAFIERVWRWREQSGDRISDQLRRMGSSVDWSRERFTMDAGLSAAVLRVFERLYDEGLIYRGKRLVNWDPVLHTALSDLEVLSQEEDGHLWHLRYPLEGGDDFVTVATTRPETMLGDTAVAVHPDDERYRALIGKQVQLPLCDRQIPVIADAYVDPEFASGCVKITPAHDFNDYEMGRRHALEMINILNDDASLNENCPAAYRGLDRFAAREKVVSDLDALGLIERIDDHKLTVPRGDRSHAIVEPYLTDQWYVKIEPLAGPAIAAVENGQIRFVPENWSKTYFEWMRNIRDWCISRQLWWGHRIPAWYDGDGNIYVAADEKSVREKYRLPDDLELRQDDDVLDTWFSSALWPFSTLGWPEKTKALKTFYPTTVLVTGFDIIFFWVARMIMMGLKFTGEVPFGEIYIHGLIRDQDGQKMSKSKGNVLDPLDLVDGIGLDDLLEKRTADLMQPRLKPKIEKATRKQFPDGIAAFGADSLRFTFASLATTGRDIRFEFGRIEGYRNFCNKLWNAARFVFMNTEDRDCGITGECQYSVADRWIRSRLNDTVDEVARQMRAYRLDLAAKALYEFTWNEFCDWYLELSKTVLQDDSISDADQRGTRQTLIRVLEALLRAIHPIMPFISEEIWQKAAPLAGVGGESIMLAAFPAGDEFDADAIAVEEMNWLQGVIVGVRQIRGEMDIAPTRALPILLRNAGSSDQERLAQLQSFLLQVGKLESIRVLDTDEKAPESATALLGQMEILVPMAGLIDRDAELARLKKQTERLEKDLKRTKPKLANLSFSSKAPKAVVEKTKKRVAELEDALSRLDEQISKVEKLGD
jgi:valyl-tRNA synthetase